MSTNSTTQALTQKIPKCFGTLWSGKRDSNSRPRPWQGRALPTELFPLRFANRVFVTTRHNQSELCFCSRCSENSAWRLSGKRDSNSRPRPWQGRALPTELFPLFNCAAKVQLFSIPQAFLRKFFFLYGFQADFAFIRPTLTGSILAIYALIFDMGPAPNGNQLYRVISQHFFP